MKCWKIENKNKLKQKVEKLKLIGLLLDTA